MFKFKFVVVSESASVDRDSGNLSLFNIISGLQAPAFPVLMQKMVITTMFEKDPEDKNSGEVELTIKQKDENDFVRKIPYNSQGSNTGQIIITLNGFVFKNVGNIQIIIKNEKSQIKTTIRVDKIGTSI